MPTEPCPTLFSALKGKRAKKTTLAPAAAPIPETGTAVKPETPMRAGISSLYIEKEIHKKSVCLVRHDYEPGPSQEQEKEAEPDITSPESMDGMKETRRVKSLQL